MTDVITGDETWVLFFGIASKCRNKAWLGPNDQKHQIYQPRFQSRKRMFTIFFNHLGSLAVNVLPVNNNTTGPNRIMQKQFCPKSSRRLAASVQSAPPRTSSFSKVVLVPTKQGP